MGVIELHYDAHVICWYSYSVFSKADQGISVIMPYHIAGLQTHCLPVNSGWPYKHEPQSSPEE